jgi:hypothetical protein
VTPLVTVLCVTSLTAVHADKQNTRGAYCIFFEKTDGLSWGDGGDSAGSVDSAATVHTYFC